MDGRIRQLTEVMLRKYGVSPTHALSVPGRVELGGNHTDHNRGKVLAAAVDLDMTAVAAPLDDPFLIAYSEADGERRIDLTQLDPVPAERLTSRALMRGVVRNLQSDFKTGGLLIVYDSQILPGAGLASSAAFEILIGGAISAVYNDGSIPPLALARAGQASEVRDFGKPSGLMDQLASVTGGVVAIDFALDEPVIESLPFDLEATGCRLVIVNTGGSHTDLTDAYNRIPDEMHSIAAVFNERDLQAVKPSAFLAGIKALRALGNDRAVLRAFHFFAETARVPAMLAALQSNDMNGYFALVRASGQSSALWLQNTKIEGMPEHQPLHIALALSEHFLGNEGAARVQGGGFAGTIQAYVRLNRVDDYMAFMDDVFGDSSCTVVRLRTAGLTMKTLDAGQ